MDVDSSRHRPRLGTSVLGMLLLAASLAADVNGDGHLDLLVGANLADIAGVEDTGELFLYLGPTLAQRFELTRPTLQAALDFGTFADASDLDGDGAAELLVCSPGAGGHAGSVFVTDF